jgi:circadian clock protein KaiB
MTAPFRFRVYVIAGTPRAQRTEQHLRRLCEERLGSAFEIEIVDVEQQPDIADAERIVAVPTLDRIEPLPRVRIVGDLTIVDKATTILGLPIVSGGDIEPP